MSKILRRPMFRGGGKVSSYGNGIASGLADGGMPGKRGLVDGPGGYAGVDTRTYDRFQGFNSQQPVRQSDFLNFLNANAGSQVGPVLTGGEISDKAMERFKSKRFFDSQIEVDDEFERDENDNKVYKEDQLDFDILDYKDTNTGGLGEIAKDNKTLANLLEDQIKFDSPPTSTKTTIQDSILDVGEPYESPTMAMKQAEMNEVPAGVIKLNANPEDPEIGVRDLIQTNSDMFNEMLSAGTKERNEKRLKKARITDASNFGLDLFAKSTKEGATVRSMFGEAAENLASKPSKTETLKDKQDDQEDKTKLQATALAINDFIAGKRSDEAIEKLIAQSGLSLANQQKLYNYKASLESGIKKSKSLDTRIADDNSNVRTIEKIRKHASSFAKDNGVDFPTSIVTKETKQVKGSELPVVLDINDILVEENNNQVFIDETTKQVFQVIEDPNGDGYIKKRLY